MPPVTRPSVRSVLRRLPRCRRVLPPSELWRKSGALRKCAAESGFFYGLLAGETIEEALRLGWPHGALLTTTPGDTTMVTLEQVKAFARGGSARIQR
jgi:hypothetical protein